MEDFRVDVIVGKGAGATSIPLDLPHFTLVGATTRAGLLPSPLRDRFGFTAQLDFYEADELSQIIKRSSDLLEIEIDGAKQVKSHMPEAMLVFLSPPSWEDLVSRLEGRGTDSPERRTERLALAQEELAAAPSFDLVIVNTSVKEVVDQLVSLLSA